MTLEEFQDELDSHGCKLADWPAEQARAASFLLAESAAAQAALAEAERLDRALSGMLTSEIKAPSRLKAAIFDNLDAPRPSAEILAFPTPTPMPAPVQPVATRPVRHFWTSRAGMAAAVMLACFAGGICTQSVFSSPAEVESSYIAAVYGDLAH